MDMFLYCSFHEIASEGLPSMSTSSMNASARDASVRLAFTPPPAFAETAASIRRAFDELRAAEDALERQLTDIRAQIDACAQPRRRPKAS